VSFGHSPANATVIEAEPQVVEFLVALVKALNRRYVIETGTYHGTTAKAIGRAIGGHLDTIEIDEYSANLARQEVLFLPVTVHHMSSLDFKPDRPVDFAFLDSGVEIRKLELDHFRPFLAQDHLIAFHDSRDIRPDLDGWRWVDLPTPRGLLLLQAP
jgi:predicted O-methyltransferase YrrM